MLVNTTDKAEFNILLSIFLLGRVAVTQASVFNIQIWILLVLTFLQCYQFVIYLLSSATHM